MSLIASDPGGDYELAPEGTHVARCYRIIDLGTQYSEYYQTYHRKAQIYWELPDEKMEDGRPFSVQRRLTISLSSKGNLRPLLEAWRGRKFTAEELAGFQLTKVLGAPCLINVAHSTEDKNQYANVQSVMALPKGQECPPAINHADSFDIDDPNMPLFETFSEKVKETIRKCAEWKSEETQEETDVDGDIPF